MIREGGCNDVQLFELGSGKYRQREGSIHICIVGKSAKPTHISQHTKRIVKEGGDKANISVSDGANLISGMPPLKLLLGMCLISQLSRSYTEANYRKKLYKMEILPEFSGLGIVPLKLVVSHVHSKR